MNSLILRNMMRFLASLLLVASVFLLWRGHNEPGGGFAGGLMAASAFVLHALALGPDGARRALRVSPLFLIATGLGIALLAALIGVMAGDPILTGHWVTLDTPGAENLKVGTPLLFDAGVYLVVVGVVLNIILPLMEDE
ncbi:MAG: Na+/H+ antiporter subunit B [Chloroflexi bacterium]|nr:Na+/H+ antiporter subunit B [Chloroflexota bacterium]PWB44957.1 MAG: Na(+)/H(+) antiporter subunit B [Dehalococcoidia bacterium]